MKEITERQLSLNFSNPFSSDLKKLEEEMAKRGWTPIATRVVGVHTFERNVCCFCGQAVKEDDMKEHLLTHHKTLLDSIESSRRINGGEFPQKINTWSVCNCECHHTEGMDHCIPCCGGCYICRQNISGLADNHVFDAHPETWQDIKDLLEELTLLPEQPTDPPQGLG